MIDNLVKLYFLFNAFFVSFLGLLINLSEPYLPLFIVQIFRHGKFSAKIKKDFISQLEVPKSFFKHFYAISAPLTILIFTFTCRLYFFNKSLPEFIFRMLDFCLNESRQPLVSAENTLLALTLFMIHCCKRFYESHYINVFSDSKMNFSIYIVGITHYIGCIISIIGESAGFVQGIPFSMNFANLRLIDLLCATIILLSSYMQYKTNVILANLRKNKKGVVISKEYKIPCGGLFELITSPLQFTEIIIYMCFTIILRKSSTFYYVLIWVITNQLECAYLSHQWHVNTFKNYPKSRRIIIPFLY